MSPKYRTRTRGLTMQWTCSDYVHHSHRFRWVAWLCGRAQLLAATLRSEVAK